MYFTPERQVKSAFYGREVYVSYPHNVDKKWIT